MCLYVVNWSVFTPAFHSMRLLRLFAFHSLFFFTFVRWLLLHFLRLGSAFATTTRIHIQRKTVSELNTNDAKTNSEPTPTFNIAMRYVDQITVPLECFVQLSCVIVFHRS